MNKSVNCVDSTINTFLETKEEKLKLCVQFNLPVLFSLVNNVVHKEK